MCVCQVHFYSAAELVGASSHVLTGLFIKKKQKKEGKQPPLRPLFPQSGTEQGEAMGGGILGGHTDALRLRHRPPRLVNWDGKLLTWTFIFKKKTKKRTITTKTSIWKSLFWGKRLVGLWGGGVAASPPPGTALPRDHRRRQPPLPFWCTLETRS